MPLWWQDAVGVGRGAWGRPDGKSGYLDSHPPSTGTIVPVT